MEPTLCQAAPTDPRGHPMWRGGYRRNRERDTVSFSVQSKPSHALPVPPSPEDTMNAAAILAAVTERDIDLLLLEEVHVSPAFRRWLAATLLDWHDPGLRLLKAMHSVTVAALGESDIEVVFGTSGERRRAILVENKVDAPLQPGQGRRYCERGQLRKERGEWDDFRTILMAPAHYLAKAADKAGFHTTLSYEQLKKWFDRASPDRERAAYKSTILQLAIEQSRRGYAPRIDARVTEYFRNYWNRAREEFPELAMKEPTKKTIDSSWISFRPSDLEKGRLIWHKMRLGRVDLELAGAAESVERLKTRYGRYLAPQAVIERAGKAAAIRITVPVLDTLAPFEEQVDKIRAGLRAACRLYYQARFIQLDIH